MLILKNPADLLQWLVLDHIQPLEFKAYVVPFLRHCVNGCLCCGLGRLERLQLENLLKQSEVELRVIIIALGFKGATDTLNKCSSCLRLFLVGESHAAWDVRHKSALLGG